MLVGEKIEGNMERLTGRWKEHRQPEDEGVMQLKRERCVEERKK